MRHFAPACLFFPFGLLGFSFAEAYRGSEMDILTTMLVMEGLGYGCRDNGLIFALNAQMWNVQHPIATVGSQAHGAGNG